MQVREKHTAACSIVEESKNLNLYNSMRNARSMKTARGIDNWEMIQDL
jgi:hypothetical protein